MASTERGEVSILIDGKNYTLSLSLNAMAALEEMFSEPGKDVTFEQVSARADAGSIKHVRAMIWAVFQDYHPEVKVTATPAEREAGALDVSTLVKHAGGLNVLTLTLAKLAAAAAPDEKDLKRLGVKKNPRTAQGGAGTGERSTSGPASRA